MGERTGSRIFFNLWPYVLGLTYFNFSNKFIAGIIHCPLSQTTAHRWLIECSFVFLRTSTKTSLIHRPRRERAMSISGPSSSSVPRHEPTRTHRLTCLGIPHPPKPVIAARNPPSTTNPRQQEGMTGLKSLPCP
ncbi:hypothetical protein BJ508DRAFT_125347 [Ascobolus immersus RN42]|uniref:Uncharacterized protein n=1 Tax=Ascobolus immersus RN42 TaxID=1160509 RepID=A0A3N4I401_ASCIM|nr:hypothetical protein BJ508DRAFT_125347 [Ascobolus immersus RN42]